MSPASPYVDSIGRIHFPRTTTKTIGVAFTHEYLVRVDSDVPVVDNALTRLARTIAAEPFDPWGYDVETHQSVIARTFTIQVKYRFEDLRRDPERDLQRSVTGLLYAAYDRFDRAMGRLGDREARWRSEEWAEIRGERYRRIHSELRMALLNGELAVAPMRGALREGPQYGDPAGYSSPW